MSQIYYDAGPPAAGKKVCLTTTAYDGLDPSHVFSLQRSRMALDEIGIRSDYLLIAGNCHVDDARNTAIREFLRTDCTHLVFLDADVSWDPDQLIRLCNYDVDVVGGIYPYRREGMQDALPVRPLLGDGDLPPDGLVEVEGLPTGFLKISRKAIELVADFSKQHYGAPDFENPIPVLFERTIEDDIRWGGDINFCRKWRGISGKVYAIADMRLGHAGKTVHVDSFAAVVRRANGMTLRHVCEAIKEGKENESHYLEAFDAMENRWGVPPETLAALVSMARTATGPIIETGSGLSTILMAAATDQTIFCLEHDPLYATKLQQMVYQAGVEGVGLCYAPINGDWYDLTDYPDLPGEFYLGVNDGPPRAVGDRKTFFYTFGSSCEHILVDDANDPEYEGFIKEWGENNGWVQTKMDPRTTIMTCKLNAGKEVA